MTRTIQSQGKKKATTRDSLPRTPTTEEDSLSVVLLTRTLAFGIKHLLEEIKTLLSRCWVCGLGWVLFVFCHLRYIVLTSVNPIFLLSCPFSLQKELNALASCDVCMKSTPVPSTIPLCICESTSKLARRLT